MVAEEKCTLAELVAYFARLGTLGFGGPIALAGAMQRDLVDRKQWISLREYKEGLALAQLAPVPLAAQLAIYLGWVRFGNLGATVVLQSRSRSESASSGIAEVGKFILATG